MTCKKLLLPAILCLSACGYVHPSTLADLSQLDPIAANPQGIVVQLRHADDVDVDRNGARLQIVAQWPAQGKSFDHTYALKRRGSLFFVAPAELPRLNRDLDLVRAWRDQGQGDVRGAISVDATLCKTGPSVDLSTTASILISTDRGKTFMPILSDVPLVKIVPDDRLHMMRDCT